MENELRKINSSKSSLTGKLDLTKINLGDLTETLNELELPRLFYQLVIFMIDGSRSMENKATNNKSKAASIGDSISSILKRLKSSKNKNCFDLSFIVFSDEFLDVFGEIKNVTDIEDTQNFNPLELIKESKGTKLCDALRYSQGTVNDYFSENEEKNCQALVIILSDGYIDDNNNALSVAQEIKSMDRVKVACQYFEKNITEDSNWYSWDESTGKLNYDSKWTVEEVREDENRISNRFKEYASEDALFMTSMDPNVIRDHMILSISLVSKTNL